MFDCFVYQCHMYANYNKRKTVPMHWLLLLEENRMRNQCPLARITHIQATAGACIRWLLQAYLGWHQTIYVFFVPLAMVDPSFSRHISSNMGGQRNKLSER